ncbi:metal ABC transporter substrate-binding protein [Leucobacter sp. USHLN153]|uniref:metal ABC transporter substrate-binding protein n=1 Tax=Leucobacter sp. USHLN153 TaxID=3081268 RepID=UPI003019EE4F
MNARKHGTRVRRTRAIPAALATATLLLTVGCAPARDAWTADPANASPHAPVVLTTFTVIADMARAVAGDHLAVRSITKAGAEIHGYEPTPLDVARASEADLILDNGLGLEAWFARFVEQTDVRHVVLSEGVEPIPIAISGENDAGKAGNAASTSAADAAASEGDTTDPAHATNPHAWMSPANAAIYVDNIQAAFTKLDPEHASDYEANAAAYREQLDALAERLTEAVDALPENHRALVTCEGAFSYLARDAGLTERYIWPVNAEQQATPQQIAGTIDFVREREVPAVFCESTVSDRPMRQVVESTDAAFGGTLYVDSLSLPDGPVPTYLDLLSHDIDTIVAGLSEGRPAS